MASNTPLSARLRRGPLALGAALFLLQLLLPFAHSEEAPLPTVMIVATGGTIAGVQNDPNDPSRYRAGSLRAEEIIQSVPALQDFAAIETLQFSNLPSPQIAPADWVRLSRTITNLLNERDDVAGVVVTHGTDRMEETAFFLHLTVRSRKPVVLVGAQRPATHMSADGPANLLAAVRTAAAPRSRDRGVLTVMDERILSAREMRKDYPRMGGFAAGRIGIVGHNGPYYLYGPSRPHTHRTEFRLREDTVLPRVDLSFSYSGGRGPSAEDPPQGLVITTTNMTCHESLAIQVLARRGIPVVTAFPTGQSLRRPRNVRDRAPDWVREHCAALADDARWEGPWIPPLPAQMLTPQKARILLMLALTVSNDRAELVRIFERY